MVVINKCSSQCGDFPQMCLTIGFMRSWCSQILVFVNHRVLYHKTEKPAQYWCRYDIFLDFLCGLCQKGFSSSSSYRRHHRDMHGDTNQQVGRSNLEIKYKLVRSGFFFSVRLRVLWETIQDEGSRDKSQISTASWFEKWVVCLLVICGLKCNKLYNEQFRIIIQSTGWPHKM